MREDHYYIEEVYLIYKYRVEKVENKYKFISSYGRLC